MHYGQTPKAILKLFKAGVDVRSNLIPVNRTFTVGVLTRENTTHGNHIMYPSANAFNHTKYERHVGYYFEETITIGASTYYDTFTNYLAQAHNDYAKILEAKKMVDDGYQLLYIPHSDTDSGVIGFGEASAPSSRYGFLCHMTVADLTPNVKADTVAVRFYGAEKIPTAYDLAYLSEPASVPTVLAFTSVLTTSMNISWTEAADTPEGYIVLYRASLDVADVPADGTTYTAGDPIGTSTVANVGRDTGFQLTGLTTGTTYYFKVFSYNGHGYTGAAVPNYLADALSGNQATA